MSSKPKRRKKEPPSEEFLHRQQVAATVMANHGITADAATGQKRCTVCGMSKKDFYFNKEHHGMSTKEDGVPPFVSRSREEKNIVFCPLADDHEIYYEHQRLRQGKKMRRNKRHDAENYKRGSTSM